MAMLSLSGGKGGYGFGVRAMRPAIIAGRTRGYSNNIIAHYDEPNGSFEYTVNKSILNVYGADGNLSGTVAATTVIDGTAQIFISGAMCYSSGYFWGFAKNALGQIRLVRADWTGNIVTPGIKFTPANAGVINDNNCFVYESGANIVVNGYVNQNQYQLLISKATGQIVSETLTVSNNATKAAATYITANGAANFASVTKGSNADLDLLVSGFIYNGNNLGSLRLFSIELMGGEVRNADTWRPVLVGDLIMFNSTSTNGLTFNYVTRAEFDRWIIDVCKKFDVVE